MYDIIGVFISDLHLGHAVPAARGEDTDQWYRAMKRMINQVSEIWESTGARIFCAGDIFDRWYVYPELINWAISALPPMVAVPGQHDLPMHNLRLMHKSAFYTLCKAGVITYKRKKVWEEGDIIVHAFPWGRRVIPLPAKERIKGKIHLALIHSYIWQKGCCYAGAPRSASRMGWRKRLSGYDVAAFGDNHLGFVTKIDKCKVINCGCLIRRRSIERDYIPAVGILRNDGSLARRSLDVTRDKWVETEISNTGVNSEVEDMGDLMKELQGMESDSISFREILWRYVEEHEVEQPIVEKLHAFVEGKK